MELMAWQSAKAQLYLLEVSYVKRAVGRDRIQRNKDALRELRCLQEILADLHAGELGGEPEKVEAGRLAAAKWSTLRSAASARGILPETLCEVPQRVRRFLLAHPGHGGSAPAPGAGSEASGSTRAPSTSAAHDFDAQSSATDARSEAAALGEGLLTRPASAGGGSRLSRQQLDDLAAVLREQLDQEYTSLLACVDEVQALMEAEVDSAGLLPSRAELAEFSEAVDGALSTLKGGSPVGKRHIGCRLGSEASPQEVRLPKDCPPAIRTEVCGVCSPAAPGSPAGRPATLRQAATRSPIIEVDEALEDALFGGASSPQGGAVRQAAVPPAAPATEPCGPRKLWADLASDSEEEDADFFGGGAAEAARPEAGGAAARAPCRGCRQLLGRTAFSRRAWRQARGAPGEEADCLACAASAVEAAAVSEAAAAFAAKRAAPRQRRR